MPAREPAEERKSILDDLRKRVQERLSLKDAEEKRSGLEEDRQPRYDEVFWDGLRWLDGSDD